MDTKVSLRCLRLQALSPLDQADAAVERLIHAQAPHIVRACQPVEVEVVHRRPCASVKHQATTC